jgi:hypothetical protein
MRFTEVRGLSKFKGSWLIFERPMKASTRGQMSSQDRHPLKNSMMTIFDSLHADPAGSTDSFVPIFSMETLIKERITWLIHSTNRGSRFFRLSQQKQFVRNVND